MVQGARTTPISSQRTRVSSVGKTPSFSFAQVDMYANDRWRSLPLVGRSEVAMQTRVKRGQRSNYDVNRGCLRTKA